MGQHNLMEGQDPQSLDSSEFHYMTQGCPITAPTMGSSSVSLFTGM